MQRRPLPSCSASSSRTAAGTPAPTICARSPACLPRLATARTASSCASVLDCISSSGSRRCTHRAAVDITAGSADGPAPSFAPSLAPAAAPAAAPAGASAPIDAKATLPKAATALSIISESAAALAAISTSPTAAMPGAAPSSAATCGLTARLPANRSPLTSTSRASAASPARPASRARRSCQTYTASVRMRTSTAPRRWASRWRLRSLLAVRLPRAKNSRVNSGAAAAADATATGPPAEARPTTAEPLREPARDAAPPAPKPEPAEGTRLLLSAGTAPRLPAAPPPLLLLLPSTSSGPGFSGEPSGTLGATTCREDLLLLLPGRAEMPPTVEAAAERGALRPPARALPADPL
mmetsp:Transcript_3121/g.12869  ORF Transcript_3121/g.12869 Transcript_3121/m.12869 type:complete len:353 (-) Transcript_3121:390-1448(-)